MSESDDQPAVSVLGLGQLGSRLAQAFLSGGHRTTVWNRTAEKADALVAQGAARATTVHEAITAGTLVVFCLPGYDTVQNLLDPEGDDLRGRVLVNLTSGTPHNATQMAAWADAHGAAYLDGAAMSGTRLVGRPEALFLFSGSPDAFTTHRAVLSALGNPMYLGGDPALASVYDTALFGLAWGTLAGFHHALALVAAEGVDPGAFAAVATGHMPFVTSLMTDHAQQVRDGRYPDDNGTVDVHLAAMDHIVHTSRAQGIRTDVPELIKTLLEAASSAGHGSDGIASLAEAIAKDERYA